MDSGVHEVVRHCRLYGDEHESLDWIHYLRYIARKPHYLKNNGIYDMMPNPMRIYMDAYESKSWGSVLRVLSKLAERGGFESALATVNRSNTRQRTLTVL